MRSRRTIRGAKAARHGSERRALAPAAQAARTNEPRTLRTVAAQGLALVAITVLIYLPALRGGVVWDDDDLIFANPFIQASNGLSHFWLTTSASDYFPLSSTVQWIEWRLWGGDVLGYHAVNIALHAGSALVLWRVLGRLAVPSPFVAAALFAVHPVSVASVAWMSELKNVLSLCLAATALLAYLRFEDGEPGRWYAAALVAFALALLAKTSVAMLPVLLLLLAWYRRGRVAAADVRRAAPFFALALVLGLVTVFYQDQAIGAANVRPEGIASRLAAAGWIVCFYLWKDLLPFGLSMIYPRWQIDPQWLPSWAALGGLVGVTILAWRRRHGWGRPVLLALGSFIVMIAPVLGLMAMTFHQHSLVSDHLQYVALIAPIAAAVAASGAALRRFVAPGAAVPVVAGLALAALSALTWQRTVVFANMSTLWTDTLAQNPLAWGAHHGLGDLFLRMGKLDEAVRHEREALRLYPDAPEAHNNLGLALAKQGDLEEAERQYSEALRLDPNYSEAHSNLGNLLVRRGRMDAGTSHLMRAIQLAPQRAELHNNLGIALAAQGKHEAAMTEYAEALRLAPSLAQAHYNLGAALLTLRRFGDAATEFRRALQLDPSLQVAQQSLELALRMAPAGQGD